MAEILILKQPYRVISSDVQYNLTNKISLLVCVNERKIHETLYSINPLIIYTKSTGFVAFDCIDEFMDIINNLNVKDKFKLI